MVPSEVSDGGADTEARMRHFLAGAHFRYDPDFLFFCNEHTFVIPENLLCYLEGLSPTEPLYLGNRFRRERQEVGLIGAHITRRHLLGTRVLGTSRRLVFPSIRE